MNTPDGLIRTPSIEAGRLGPIYGRVWNSMLCYEDHATWQLWRDELPIFIQRGVVVFRKEMFATRYLEQLKVATEVNTDVQWVDLNSLIPNEPHKDVFAICGYYRHNGIEYSETDFDRVLKLFFRLVELSRTHRNELQQVHYDW